MRRATAIAACVLVASLTLLADEISVTFDSQVDFSKFRTFAIRTSTVESGRPELDNRLFVKDLGAAIRVAFARRGVTERATAPDLFVEFRVTHGEISTSQRGVSIPGPGMRGRSGGPRPLRYTDATLVIDLKRAGDVEPIWHGVYHTDQGSGADLVRALPDGAKKLLARYPRKN
jgi:Domain of unknown function (DUF4136)